MSIAQTLLPMRLPAITHANLTASLVFGYLTFCVLYLGSAGLAFRAPWVFEATIIDRMLPFIPASIWVYLSQFLLLPWALASARNDALRSRVFYAMLFAALLSVPLFILFPSSVPRPLVATEGLLGIMWLSLHLADTPNNAFPSLHVALAALAGALLWQEKRRLIAVLWPTCIAVSTLTTRQHIAWDVVGGLLIAVFAWFLTPKLISYDDTRQHDRIPNR